MKKFLIVIERCNEKLKAIKIIFPTDRNNPKDVIFYFSSELKDNIFRIMYLLRKELCNGYLPFISTGLITFHLYNFFILFPFL